MASSKKRMNNVVAGTNGYKAAKKSRDSDDQFFPDSNNLFRFFDQPAYIELLSDVITSPAFQRLGDIRFLGAIDYLLYPNGSPRNSRHTRFDHSLGVAKLALLYSRECALSKEDEKHVVLAGLLHDVGHGPLSHSLEPVFKEKFKLSHYAATELIIRSEVSIGFTLREIFMKHGIDCEKIIALIAGTLDAPCVEIFRNPINIDTIEGISRAYTYMAPRAIQPPCSRILYAMIRRASRDETVLDAFWHLKNTVYNQLINNRTGAVADYICREYMLKNVIRFGSDVFFSTESALRKMHPGLFALLGQLRESPTSIPIGAEKTISYDMRNFFIDTSVALGDEASLYRRYRQEKIPVILHRERASASSGRSGKSPTHPALPRLL